MTEKTIRIGTRDSELALWQANTVQKQLQDLGYKTEIIVFGHPQSVGKTFHFVIKVSE